MSKYLVTGGCGFIGSHLVEALVRRGDCVRILDNLTSGHLKNISAVRSEVEFIEGDVRNEETLRCVARGVDGIFHEAAQVSVFDSVQRPRDNHEINSTGTLNVLLAAREAGVRRVVFASTAAVYGNDPELPKRETMRPSPESPYAVAKLSGEHYLRLFHTLYGLETVSLRYFNVFGPRQDPCSPYSGVVSSFVECVRSGRPPVVFGDGLQSRDFVFVRDVVQANLLAMESLQVGRGDVFNVASGSTATLLELLNALARLSRHEIMPIFQPARAGDIRHSSASIDSTKSSLGYRPAFTLDQGLGELLAHEGVSTAIDFNPSH